MSTRAHSSSAPAPGRDLPRQVKTTHCEAKKMSRPLTTVLACMLTLCAAAPAVEPQEPEQPRKKLTDEELWDVYYEFITMLKPHGIPVERDEHERVIAPEIMARDHNSIHVLVEYSVLIGNERDIIVYIDGYTGEIRAYRLRGVLRQLRNRDPVRPRLSRKEVEKKAKSYLFLNTQIEPDDYAVSTLFDDGAWLVTFKRRLGGYRFMKDSIFVEYSEEYGLVSYRNTMLSNKCDVNLKVSREQAIAKADSALENVKKERRIQRPMARQEVQGPLIVNPVLLRVRPNLGTVDMAELRKTRLAWCIWYHDAPEGGRARGDPVVVGIYIDAITGELIHSEVVR